MRHARVRWDRPILRGLSVLAVSSGIVLVCAGGCWSAATGCRLGDSPCPNGPDPRCIDQRTERYCREDECGDMEEVVKDCGITAACVDKRCEMIINGAGPNGEGVAVCQANEVSPGPSQGPFRVADVTGDGAADLVFVSDDGLQVVRAGEQGGFGDSERVEASAGTIGVFDIDADGIAEIVTAPRADATAQTHLQVVRAAQAGVLSVSPLEVEAAAPVLLAGADVRGSGALDLVVVDGRRVLALLDLLGEPSQVEVSEPSAPSAIAVLRRVDGARAELLLVEDAALVGLRLSKTGEWVRTELAEGVEGQSSPLAVDLNRNGTDDLVLLKSPTDLLVWLGGPRTRSERG
jgi:hypothetical protein